MVQYRTFRNADPPGLAHVWNEAFTGRGAVRLANSTPLEQFVFAKPTFDREGLIVAEVDGDPVGFAHAALGPAPQEGCQQAGVICALGVKVAFQEQGIGTRLLVLAEQHLRDKGAQQLYAGGFYPLNPFYLGLYGGSESPGFLRSDRQAEPFFLRHGYHVAQTIRVLQRPLSQPFKVFDPRFANLKCRFDLRVDYPRKLGGYWQECVLGPIEPLEFLLIDRQTAQPASRALLWDMEGFGARWRAASVGLLDFEVYPDYRRKGLGKLFLSYIMRQVQDQFFQVVEVHLHQDNAMALQFVKSLGFEQVDTGQVFVKDA